MSQKRPIIFRVVHKGEWLVVDLFGETWERVKTRNQARRLAKEYNRLHLKGTV